VPLRKARRNLRNRREILAAVRRKQRRQCLLTPASLADWGVHCGKGDKVVNSTLKILELQIKGFPYPKLLQAKQSLENCIAVSGVLKEARVRRPRWLNEPKGKWTFRKFRKAQNAISYEERTSRKFGLDPDCRKLADDPCITVIAADLVDSAKVFIQGTEAFKEGNLAKLRKCARLLRDHRFLITRHGPHNVGIAYYILMRKTLKMNLVKLQYYRNLLISEREPRVSLSVHEPLQCSG